MKLIKCRFYDRVDKKMVFTEGVFNRTPLGIEDLSEPMLFIGLCDKSGIEIYEGDIIKYISFDGKEYVQECPDLNCFHFWQETKDNETVEVIGNKYEA